MLTIMICGPLHKHSLNNIKNYQKHGKVIISCYDTDDINIIPECNDVVIVQSTLPSFANANSGKVFYQAWSSYQGLQYVDTEFVIRSRSDEGWANIGPFIDTMRKNPDRFTSCNIYFKGTPEPLHPSDHLYGGKTEYFKKGLKHFLEGYAPIGYAHGHIFNMDWLGAFAIGETPIFLSFLYGLGIIESITPDNTNQITFDNTALVNIDEMKPYIWACTTTEGKKYWTNSDDLYHTYPSLKSMDEFWTLRY